MTIPFHVMRSIIENLKALEDSEEAKKYLVESDSEEAIYQLLHNGKYNFPRRLYLFENNPHVTQKMSDDLTAVLRDLTSNLRESFAYENMSLANDGVFTDAMRERGYHAGIVTDQHDKLRTVSFVNTKYGIFIVT